MNNEKYVGLDTDQATIIARVDDAKGKLVMEAAIETRASSIRQFFKGLDGTMHVAFEEGTQAAWLYDVIRPLVAEVTVCDPRRNKLIQSGNMNLSAVASISGYLRLRIEALAGSFLP